jgi:hypothetical protein
MLQVTKQDISSSHPPLPYSQTVNRRVSRRLLDPGIVVVSAKVTDKIDRASITKFRLLQEYQAEVLI